MAFPCPKHFRMGANHSCAQQNKVPNLLSPIKQVLYFHHIFLSFFLNHKPSLVNSGRIWQGNSSQWLLDLSNDDLVGGATLTRTWPERTFWDDENVLYFVLCGGDKGVYGCQILLHGAFKLCACYYI